MPLPEGLLPKQGPDGNLVVLFSLRMSCLIDDFKSGCALRGLLSACKSGRRRSPCVKNFFAITSFWEAWLIDFSHHVQNIF